jgi:hypothetical protein
LSPAFVKVPGLYTYAQAKETCAAYNYTLAMPKSFPLQSNLQECSGSDTVWLGLTDSEVEGTFRWDDGTNLSTTGYNNWVFGRPYRSGFGDEE